MQKIELGNIKIEVEQKDIKNIHLSVYPPDGKVKIAAPQRMDLDTIRVFAINKLKWIKKQQETFRNQEREAPKALVPKFLLNSSSSSPKMLRVVDILDPRRRGSVIFISALYPIWLTSTPAHESILRPKRFLSPTLE